MTRLMSTRFPVHGILIASLAVVALAIAGCFESEHPVGPREAGKVDLGYVGDWTLRNEAEGKQMKPARLTIRNLHNDEYYVEFSDDDQKPSRATGHLTNVANVTFASVLPLTDDGKIAEKHSIWRIDRESDDKFTLRGLNPEFFKGKKIESSDDLRKIIVEHVKNEAMYAGDPLVAKRDVGADGAKEQAVEKK